MLAWTVSVLIGFVDAFMYAEIAGLHPKKSGGTAVHGATAWIRYIRPTAAISLWCNWLAWTPVLAIGAGLGASYLLSIFYAPDSTVMTWQWTIVNLDFLKEGLVLRINAVFIVGAFIILAVWNIQHYGILRTARVQTILTIGAITPLLVLSIIPLITGDVVSSNFSPFVPVNGSWDITGWEFFLGALFICAWTTYAFETAVCYMSEFRNPAKDMSRAILVSGLFCIFCFTLIPFVFQGVLGTEYMLQSRRDLRRGRARRMGRRRRRRRLHDERHHRPAVLHGHRGHHDGPVGVVADPVPGRPGRLAAQVPRVTSTSTRSRPTPCGPTSS